MTYYEVLQDSIGYYQISLSIRKAELLLGTWQGLYLFEHRIAAQNRVVIHHFLGE